MRNETVDRKSNEECEDDVTSDDPDSHSNVKLVTWTAVWEAENTMALSLYNIPKQEKTNKETDFQICIKELLPWFPSTNPVDESERGRERRENFIIVCSQVKPAYLYLYQLNLFHGRFIQK